MFWWILLQQAVCRCVGAREQRKRSVSVARTLVPSLSKLVLFFEKKCLRKFPSTAGFFSQRKLQFERRRRLCPAEKKKKKKEKKKMLRKHFSGTKISFIIRSDSRSERVSLRERKVGESVTKPKETSDFTSCEGPRGQIKPFMIY